MRKLLSFHVTSVDGYYEGPGQAFDWPVVDEEFNQFALRQLEEADMLLFGRATYQMMAGYWPARATSCCPTGPLPGKPLVTWAARLRATLAPGQCPAAGAF